MEIASQHRQAFSHQMHELEHGLLEMASHAESMIGQAVESLCKLDSNLAGAVLEADDELDDRNRELEAQCLSLFALQNPIGADLREISTVLKIITDVERVGDLAVDIAKCGMKIEKELGETGFIDIPKIAGAARHMFHEAIESFVKRDLSKLDKVAELEDIVDDLYRELRGQIHEHMRNHSDDVVSASWILLAIHHIERIADHALNIAERVGFMVTGKMVRMATYKPN